MAIKSISDFYSYSLFIFDLDNTIYNEEDYLFQGYDAIGEHFSGIIKYPSGKDLAEKLKKIYHEEGRDKLFNKFLKDISLDEKYISKCLEILRTFRVARPLEITPSIKNILSTLVNQKSTVFILTNGNVQQQKNKIRSIRWEGLDSGIQFVFADDHGPKPSPAGIEYILKITNTPKAGALFTGDSPTDRLSALNAGITFLEVDDLLKL
jgi:FMN phosphatase YigB (HAD superfamily)